MNTAQHAHEVQLHRATVMISDLSDLSDNH